MLGEMRDRSGAPSVATRALALVLALLLAAPLTFVVVRGLLRVVHALL